MEGQDGQGKVSSDLTQELGGLSFSAGTGEDPLCDWLLCHWVLGLPSVIEKFRPALSSL